MSEQVNLRIKSVSAFWLAMLLLVMPGLVQSQPQVCIGKQAACPGSESLVPIEVSNLSDIGAITLFITYDTTKARFIALENIHQALSGGTVVSTVSLNTNPASINISWASLTAATIRSGNLLDIRLMLIDSCCALHFQSECELATSNMSVIENVVFGNGYLSSPEVVSPEPVINFVDEGKEAHFVLPLLSNVQYRWQENSGNGWTDLNEGTNITGVFTNELVLKEVKPVMHNRMYRCLMQLNGCAENSREVTLKVSALGIGKQGKKDDPMLAVYPNPVSGSAIYIIGISCNNPELTLFNAIGEPVKIIRASKVQAGIPQALDLNDVAPGIYMLQLCERKHVLASVKIVRKL